MAQLQWWWWHILRFFVVVDSLLLVVAQMARAAIPMATAVVTAAAHGPAACREQNGGPAGSAFVPNPGATVAGSRTRSTNTQQTT